MVGMMMIRFGWREAAMAITQLMVFAYPDARRLPRSGIAAWLDVGRLAHHL